MIYVFLAEGFETVEALAPVDVMRRAGLEAVTVSISGGKTVTSRQNVTVSADITLAEVDLRKARMLMLPGGMPGADNLYACGELRDMLLAASEKGVYIAAICAAPYILGELGILRGKKATCYPGYENRLKGAFPTGERVTYDRGVLTGAGMGTAVEFGLAAVALLSGYEEAERISKAIIEK